MPDDDWALGQNEIDARNEERRAAILGDGIRVDQPREEHPTLFDVPEAWKEHWYGMPEYEMLNTRPASSIRVNFQTDADRTAFFERIGVKPTPARGIFYPSRTPRRYPDPGPTVVPLGRYPVYVISKGRADSRLTSRALDKLGIDYRLVIEPQEYDAYAEHIPAAQIVTLPFSELGQGSIPARNFVWDHALVAGAKRHWILDDNIADFARVNHNIARIVRDENPFIPCETFADRYSNVALAGMHYRGHGPATDRLPPYRLNTRVYSCILIDNSLPFRWRGKYNEDTDLALRVLKAGYVTVLFNIYRIHKMQTMSMEGGNADLYANGGRRLMAESLRDQHPDVVTLTEKWGRVQHRVNYKRFSSNELAKL